jgi:LL-diaminopimelate aminotransferase
MNGDFVMIKTNENFLNLKKSYLFIEISKRIGEFTADNPNAPLIRMGIGDVTLPLVPAVVEAGQRAFAEMGVKETFRGYEDSGRGYDFLREAVSVYYKSFGACLSPDEIFINDGAKSDSGNIGDIFREDCPVIVVDPAYPVYVDASIMGGKNVTFTKSTEVNVPENGLIYLCSPNNPTGEAYTYEQLKQWVDLANKNNAVIIYDAAYEAFITEADKPRSIFLVEGADKCAIEIASLSKIAGFTGTRCGYTVIPNEELRSIWARRQSTKFNGVSYPVQRAAQAVFSKEGMKQVQENLAYYKRNSQIITEAFTELGIEFSGGINSPYVWFRCPKGMDSWEFFDFLLKEANVVGTPGEGFGKNGDGWFRLTAFNTLENTVEAMNRIRNILK